VKKALFVLLILALAAAALGAGCGGSATSTPAAAAQLVLDLMQAGNLARASEHFVQRDTFLALIDAMRGKGKATAGSVQMRSVQRDGSRPLWWTSRVDRPDLQYGEVPGRVEDHPVRAISRDSSGPTLIAPYGE